MGGKDGFHGSSKLSNTMPPPPPPPPPPKENFESCNVIYYCHNMAMSNRKCERWSKLINFEGKFWKPFDCYDLVLQNTFIAFTFSLVGTRKQQSVAAHKALSEFNFRTECWILFNLNARWKWMQIFSTKLGDINIWHDGYRPNSSLCTWLLTKG